MSQKRRLIILGAGFSRPAGFPLAMDLWKEIRETAASFSQDLRAYKFNEDLSHYIKFREEADGKTLTPETVDFEDFMRFLDVEHYLGLRGGDTWSEDGNEGTIVTKFLIGRTHLPIEILEATRSALDQCAYAAAKISGNTRLKRTQFPIADTFDNLTNLIIGRKVCQDVPAEIVNIFVGFHPYEGGNGELWALNKLRNSTHTSLVPIAVRGANIRIRHSKRISTGELTALSPVFDSAKHELAFARSGVDDRHAFGASPTFNIGFERSILPDRRHAVAFLTAAVNTVESVVQEVETACIRLGFI
jgi:hypothetical protein